MPDKPFPSQVRKILVATDRSESADRAVRWAAEMADRYQAELILLQVVFPQAAGEADGRLTTGTHELAVAQLQQDALEVAGERGRARVVVDEDPARAIVQASDDAAVDVVVVGNVGMSGRTSFLLGNVPNRVSHNARCHVIIVNTARPGVAEGRLRSGAIPVAPGVRAEAPPEHEGRLFGRAARIARVLARVGFAELFSAAREGDEDAVRERAQKVRRAMEELGPTFAKMGQILSTRPDLLPQAFVEELSTLQDQVPPLTEEEVVKVMEEELGVPWEDVFASIDPQPMAAGTIAQVHKATLADGEPAVIKVQRPTARTDILQDLGLLELFAEKTQERSAFRQVIDLPTIIEHLSASLRRELDFRQEAANLQRMHDVLQPFSRLDVPEVYTDFSTDRLLVMQEIQGGPIREAPEGSARIEAARQLLESYYQQILVDGFFHADPHPGNMMWWNDRIYFLDLGMVGEIDPETRNLMLLLLMAFWRGDVNFLADVVLMLAGEEQRPDLDVEGFEAEVGGLLNKTRGLSLREMQLGPILQEITEISIRHGVRLPASLALTGKALAQMQLATAELDPSLDPLSVVGDFMMKGFLGRFRERADPRWLFYEGQKLRTRIVRLMEAIERLSGARPGPKLQVHFKGTEGLESTIRRAGRHVSLAMTGGGALVGAAIAGTSPDVAGWLPSVLWVVGGLLTGGLVVDLLRRKR
jgi:predicted unusual protein kinase regulating ubiquinone biosynthesis (AarF/ABC1/UbiB family)/nucleotide-binding universal stress UspA family protein